MKNEEHVNIEFIHQIKYITPPSKEQMESMTLEEWREWKDKLYPYYLERSVILRELGIEEWSKVINWPFYYRKVEELEAKKNAKLQQKKIKRLRR